ncbi:MAG: holo-ACP synthase [bacterium]
MILGIGVDLVDVRRFESIIFRWQHRFLKRIFTDKEIRYCNTKKHPAQRFATRFAAKEAFIKALFPRGQKGIRFCDIEIGQQDARPFINLNGEVKRLAAEQGISKVHLMVSHDGDYGIANVVLEK